MSWEQEVACFAMPQIVLDQIKSQALVEREPILSIAGVEIRINKYLPADLVVASDREGIILAFIRLGGEHGEGKITVVPEEERRRQRANRGYVSALAWAEEEMDKEQGRRFRIERGDSNLGTRGERQERDSVGSGRETDRIPEDADIRGGRRIAWSSDAQPEDFTSDGSGYSTDLDAD